MPDALVENLRELVSLARVLRERIAIKRYTLRVADRKALTRLADAIAPDMLNLLVQPRGPVAPLPTNPADITLSLSGSGSAIDLAITASLTSGRTAVQYEVQRSLNQSDWSTLTLSLQAASTVPARSTATPTKYVDPSGDLDGNVAYTTIQAAANAAVAGDEIVVNGTFNEQVLITTSGTSGSPIRFRAWDYDNKPVVDGSSLGVGWDNSEGSAHLVAIGAEHVIWDGIDIQDSAEHGIGIGDVANNGFFISNSSSWHEGLKVIRTKVRNCPGVGVTMLMTQSAYFGDCDFSECQRGAYWDNAAGNPVGWGYAVQLSGRDPWLDECIVRETMGEGVHVGHHNAYLSGPSRALSCSGFKISSCTFYDCWSAPIYFTVCEDGVVERNTIFMSDDDRFWWARDNATGYPQYGVAFGSELGAFGNPTTAFDMTYVGCQNIVIRNNVINGANRLFQFASFAGDGGIANYKNIDIDHNTIFCTKGAFSSIYQALRNSMDASTDEMTGIRFRNNAVLVSDASDIATTWNALGSGKVVAGNLFSHSPPSDLSDASNIIDAGSTVLTDKTYSVTGVAWPDAKTFDITKAAPYLSGSTVSPLVNAATSISVTDDFYGNTRPSDTGLADIGAISLSKPASLTYVDATATDNVVNYYRARFRDSTGQLSGWSDVESITP